jgi:hypothetical protein
MSLEVDKKKLHLQALKSFMASPAYMGYLDGINADIALNEKAQVDMPLTKIEDLVELLQLKGEHRCLEQSRTLFEDARANLSKRIDDMVEAELQNADQTKK